MAVLALASVAALNVFFYLIVECASVCVCLFVRACVREGACVRVCACVCACVRACVRVCACVRACVRAYVLACVRVILFSFFCVSSGVSSFLFCVRCFHCSIGTLH